MAIKLADTLAPMSEFPAAMAEHIGFSDGATLQEKFDNKELGGGDSSVTLTQEEYEALPEEEKLDGLYYTYDTKRIYKNGVQYGASEPIPLTMEEYKALKEAGAIDEKQEYLIEAGAEGILLGAEDIGYNNAESGIEATTVQGAVDKVVEKIDSKTEINDTSSSTTNTYSSAKIDTELTKKLSKNYNLSLTDANTVIDNANGLYIYRVGSGCLNIPVNRIGVIISNNYSDTQYKRITQTYMTNDDNAVNGLIYMRYGMSNNSGSTYTWSDWKQISYLDDTSSSETSTWSGSKIANETAKKKQVMRLPFTISDNKFSVKYSDVLALIDKYCNFEDSGVKQNAYVPIYLTCYTSNNNTLLSCFAKFEGGIYLDRVMSSSNESPAKITRESDVNFISIELGGNPTSLFVTI